MPKPMTPMEKAVGRRLPPHPKHLDTVMARWAEDVDHPQKARLAPSEEWLRPAFRKAVRNGWLRRTSTGISLMGSRAEFFYVATDKGLSEARSARLRVEQINASRAEWSRDSDHAIREGRFPPPRGADQRLPTAEKENAD
ncbi:hypothetical protein G6L37_00955 [Agrobacterium rubi]|nr:hypothetical protein [Agrobacterium rubi]NTF23960.1 hypothetical protein [Agrobacterium rubi]